MKDKIKQNRWAQGAFVLLFAAFASFILIHIHAATPTTAIEAESGTLANGTSVITDSAASGGSAVKFGTASGCQISAILVNSCRPLYGAAMAVLSPYPQAAGSDIVSQMQYQDTRIGHTSDIAHTFNTLGNNSLSTAQKGLVNDGYTLMANWKPASPWSSGFTAACAAATDSCTPSGAADDSAIDTMATSLKSVAPHKVMLVIWHEPENDVTPGGADCTVAKGASGSASDYVNMWRYAENRLKKVDNVTNVVYVEYFQNYAPLLCNNINQLYAGDNYVDWIMFDNYVSSGTFGNALSWDNTIGGTTTINGASVPKMYAFLTQNSNGSHNYLSKPWGLSEIGIANEGTANEEAWYEQAATAVTANTFPNLKAYVDFDEDNTSSDNNEYRQAYDDTNVFTQAKQDHYNDFVNAIYSK